MMASDAGNFMPIFEQSMKNMIDIHEGFDDFQEASVDMDITQPFKLGIFRCIPETVEHGTEIHCHPEHDPSTDEALKLTLAPTQNFLDYHIGREVTASTFTQSNHDYLAIAHLFDLIRQKRSSEGLPLEQVPRFMHSYTYSGLQRAARRQGILNAMMNIQGEALLTAQKQWARIGGREPSEKRYAQVYAMWLPLEKIPELIGTK